MCIICAFLAELHDENKKPAQGFDASTLFIMLNITLFPALYLNTSAWVQYDGLIWEMSAMLCPLHNTFTTFQLQLIMPKLATIHHEHKQSIKIKQNLTIVIPARTDCLLPNGEILEDSITQLNQECMGMQGNRMEVEFLHCVLHALKLHIQLILVPS